MIVMKFGGTSVGTPERMQEVADIVFDQSGSKVVVLSALSGTTNSLVEIAGALYVNKHDLANTLIDKLEEQYNQFVTKLYFQQEFLKKSEELVQVHFDHIRTFTQDLFTLYEERAILAQGELISTALFQYLLEETGRKSRLISSLDFMRIDKDGEPDVWYIQDNLNRILGETPDMEVFICQGYIARNAYGEIDNLKRGGSDYTASLVGAALQADEIQIWTDIDGMHNNDPRIVEDTFPIEELSYKEAAELAYFGAKILHPSSVRPAEDRKIPVLLKNTMNPQARGTVISENAKSDSIKAIAAKDDITAIKIRSGRMLMAYGFLRNVFEVFERYKTPIDMITTSEVAVSITIDDASHLESIVKELKVFGEVEVDTEQVIICIVGDLLSDKKGYADQIFSSLSEIPIRMISYGGSSNNVTILLNKDQKTGALQALNAGLFNRDEA